MLRSLPIILATILSQVVLADGAAARWLVGCGHWFFLTTPPFTTGGYGACNAAAAAAGGGGGKQDGWMDIDVPSNWQLECLGCNGTPPPPPLPTPEGNADVPVYTNIKYPFDAVTVAFISC